MNIFWHLLACCASIPLSGLFVCRAASISRRADLRRRFATTAQEPEHVVERLALLEAVERRKSARHCDPKCHSFFSCMQLKSEQRTLRTCWGSVKLSTSHCQSHASVAQSTREAQAPAAGGREQRCVRCSRRGLEAPAGGAKRQLNKPTTKSSKVDAVTLPAPAAGAWDEEEEEEEEEASANAPPPSKGADVPSEAPSGGQRVACTVFLGQLPYAADEAKIRRFLKDSGVIGGVRVRLLTDRESRRSRGMATSTR